MPQSTDLLTQMGRGYAPLATGIAQPYGGPTRGIPGLSHGMGALAGMAMTPQLFREFGQVGMVPMGIGHDQNVYDTLLAKQFSQMQMESMRMAAESDRRGFMRTMRGLAAVTGTPFGAEQRRAAMAISNMATSMAPMLTEMMPEFMDQLGGARGSATVMARRIIDAGRYRIDPVTGRMGMSAETVGDLTNRLHSNLFSDENIRSMKGMTAGQAGSLFGELQNRGLISGAGSEAKAGLNSMSGADLDKLSLDPRFVERLRTIDAERIKRSLRGYASAVSAMRDIFGDMGKPNAPMSELLNGLEALTMGGGAQFSPQRLSAIARQTYNLAKQTGVTLDAALSVQHHAGQYAQQMGLEPVFAIHATQGSLGFGGAYRGQGHAAHTAWGAMNADQLQQLDANLRVQAAGSNMANRMAVVMRVADTAGGFEEGSDQDRLSQALRLGLNQWTDKNGKLRSVLMKEDELSGLLSGAKNRKGQSLGLTDSDVGVLAGQQDTNREFVDKYNMVNVVRRAQGREELHPFVAANLENTLTDRLTGHLTEGGMKSPQARERARQASSAIATKATQRIFQLSTEEFADRTMRNRGVSEAIEDELNKAGFGDVLKGMSPGQKQQFLTQTAEQFYGNTNSSIRDGIYSAFGNMQNVHRLTNEGTLNEADRQQMRASFRSSLEDSMSGLGKGTMLSRSVDALQHVRHDDPDAMRKVLAQSLGGVKVEDINRSLMPHFQRILQYRGTVETLQAQLEKTTDPAERAKLATQLQSAMRELKAHTDELVQAGASFGLFTTETATPEDIARAKRSAAGLMGAQNDIIGLSGGFGHEVTDAEIARVKGTGTQNETETAAVWLARHRGDYAKLKGIDMTRAVKADTPEEARALIRTRRRMLPIRESDEAVEALAKEKGITPGLARELSNSRLRAARLGVLPSDYQREGQSPQEEMAALADVFAARSNKMFDVSDADRAQLEVDNPELAKPSQDVIDLFKKQNPAFAGASEADVKKEMLTRLVIGRRQNAQKQQFSQFWASAEGEGFREIAERAGQDVEDIAVRLIQSPQGVQRFGTRAIEMSKQLRAGQQRLRELAMYHTGGDVARLLARDFDIDQRDPRGKETADRVRAEIAEIQKFQYRAFEDYNGMFGREGRQFELGTTAQAEKNLGMTGNPFTRAPADQIKIYQEREKIGNRAEALRLMGKRPGDKLTPEEEQRLKKLEYDIGIARHITPEQDRVLGSYDAKQDSIRRLAKQHGLTFEEAERIAGSKAVGGVLFGMDTSAIEAAIPRSTARSGVAPSMLSIGVSMGLGGGVTVPTLTDDDVARLKAKFADLDVDKKQIAEIAGQMGVRPGDISGVLGISKLLVEAQRKALREEDVNPQDIVKGLLNEYGLGDGELSARAKQMAGAMEGTRGKNMGQRMLKSAKTVRAVAERFGGGKKGLEGVDNMADEYFEILKKGGTLTAFQKKYGFDVDERGMLTGSGMDAWKEFESAMQFQQQTGLLRFGKGGDAGRRTKTTEADLSDLFSTNVMRDPSDAGSQGQHITLSGKVKIDWDSRTMDVSGAHGGSINHAVPGGR